MTSSLAQVSTFTLSAGRAPSRTAVPIHATSAGSWPQVTFQDAASGALLRCDSSDLRGTSTTGSGLDGSAIVRVDGARSAMTGCTGVSGSRIDVSGVGSWKVTATTPNSRGVDVEIDDVRFSVRAGQGCRFSLSGTVYGRFNDVYSNVALLKRASLTLGNVEPGRCAGSYANGDRMGFSGVYNIQSIVPAQNPVTIAGP